MGARLACFALVVGAAACAPDLRCDFPFDGDRGCAGQDAGPEGPKISLHFDSDAGVRDVVVDATSKTARVYLDLDADAEQSVDQALATNAWDLAFRRDNVASNGGSATDNPGSVAIAVLKDVGFDGLTQAPAAGYRQDGAQTVLNEVEGGWYVYDLSVHRLTARADLTYVVRTGAGAYFKLKFSSYYDEAGSPARISLRYQRIAAPN